MRQKHSQFPNDEQLLIEANKPNSKKLSIEINRTQITIVIKLIGLGIEHFFPNSNSIFEWLQRNLSDFYLDRYLHMYQAHLSLINGWETTMATTMIIWCYVLLNRLVFLKSLHSLFIHKQIYAKNWKKKLHLIYLLLRIVQEFIRN